MTKRKKDYLCEFSSDNDNWESITKLKKNEDLDSVLNGFLFIKEWVICH